MTMNYHKIVLSNLPEGEVAMICEILEAASALSINAIAIGVPAHGSDRVVAEFYCFVEPAVSDIRDVLSLATDDDVLSEIAITMEPVADRDWVAESQAGLPPIRAGRFFVHGAHDRAGRPAGGHAIEIEAGQAFGSGHHGTTKGCLLAFDRILKKRMPARVLDVGCGSGILAIAAARATKRRVMAGDIDPVAVRVAAENAAKNNVGAYVRTVVATGTRQAGIRAGAPYDVVFANILARPLISLAPSIRSVLAVGGRAILSGLTVDQEARVLSAYRLQGLALVESFRLEGWSTLVVARGTSRRGACPKRRRECRRG
jgi:ribosomal protein L11 methyltransferase